MYDQEQTRLNKIAIGIMYAGLSFIGAVGAMFVLLALAASV